MINDVKLVLVFIGVAVMSAFIRYKTFAIAVSDTVLGFLSGYISYLWLSYFNISDECRCGISGVLIMYARPLYDFINLAITTKLSEWLEYKIKK